MLDLRRLSIVVQGVRLINPIGLRIATGEQESIYHISSGWGLEPAAKTHLTPCRRLLLNRVLVLLQQELVDQVGGGRRFETTWTLGSTRLFGILVILMLPSRDLLTVVLKDGPWPSCLSDARLMLTLADRLPGIEAATTNVTPYDK